jgi:hypothetical protein
LLWLPGTAARMKAWIAADRHACGCLAMTEPSLSTMRAPLNVIRCVICETVTIRHHCMTRLHVSVSSVDANKQPFFSCAQPDRPTATAPQLEQEPGPAAAWARSTCHDAVSTPHLRLLPGQRVQPTTCGSESSSCKLPAGQPTLAAAGQVGALKDS